MAAFLVWGWLCIMRTGWHGEELRASCRSTVFGLYLSTVREKPVHRTSWKTYSRPLKALAFSRVRQCLCYDARLPAGSGLQPPFHLTHNGYRLGRLFIQLPRIRCSREFASKILHSPGPPPTVLLAYRTGLCALPRIYLLPEGGE